MTDDSVQPHPHGKALPNAGQSPLYPAGGRSHGTTPSAGTGSARRFLSVHYRCCHAYGRLMLNATGDRYEGRCPRCGRRASAVVGPGGTSQRIFEAW